MIKVMLFDTDGMIIRRPLRFSDRYAEDFDVHPGVLNDFFAHEFQECLVGKRDLKQELAKRVESWGWDKSVEELMEYWFAGESDIDSRVLETVSILRARNIDCYVETNNEKYRMEYMFETMGLKDYFDGALASSTLGHKKPEPAFWAEAHRRVGEPEKDTVLVWDDDDVNVRSAREFGFQAYQYTNFDDYKEQMELLVGPLK